MTTRFLPRYSNLSSSFITPTRKSRTRTPEPEGSSPATDFSNTKFTLANDIHSLLTENEHLKRRLTDSTKLLQSMLLTTKSLSRHMATFQTYGEIIDSIRRAVTKLVRAHQGTRCVFASLRKENQALRREVAELTATNAVYNAAFSVSTPGNGLLVSSLPDHSSTNSTACTSYRSTTSLQSSARAASLECAPALDTIQAARATIEQADRLISEISAEGAGAFANQERHGRNASPPVSERKSCFPIVAESSRHIDGASQAALRGHILQTMRRFSYSDEQASASKDAGGVKGSIAEKIQAVNKETSALRAVYAKYIQGQLQPFHDYIAYLEKEIDTSATALETCTCERDSLRNEVASLRQEGSRCTTILDQTSYSITNMRSPIRGICDPKFQEYINNAVKDATLHIESSPQFVKERIGTRAALADQTPGSSATDAELGLQFLFGARDDIMQVAAALDGIAHGARLHRSPCQNSAPEQ